MKNKIDKEMLIMLIKDMEIVLVGLSNISECPVDNHIIGTVAKDLLQKCSRTLEKIECNHSCGYCEPYGFVPEAGCPIHD